MRWLDWGWDFSDPYVAESRLESHSDSPFGRPQLSFDGLDYPVEISDDETIVRCIFRPQHVSSNGRLKKDAFEPNLKAPGGLSVIRHDHVGSTFCKTKAKEIETQSPTKKEYVGLATITAREITGIDGVTIKDSREQYPGHSDIFYHGVTPAPAQEATSAAVKHRAKDYAKSLLGLARYYPDPDVDAQEWMGPSPI